MCSLGLPLPLQAARDEELVEGVVDLLLDDRLVDASLINDWTMSSWECLISSGTPAPRPTSVNARPKTDSDEFTCPGATHLLTRIVRQRSAA